MLPYETLGIVGCNCVSIDNIIVVKFALLFAQILLVLENAFDSASFTTIFLQIYVIIYILKK